MTSLEGWLGILSSSGIYIATDEASTATRNKDEHAQTAKRLSKAMGQWQRG
jgi:hypothetical protein